MREANLQEKSIIRKTVMPLIKGLVDSISEKLDNLQKSIDSIPVDVDNADKITKAIKEIHIPETPKKMEVEGTVKVDFPKNQEVTVANQIDTQKFTESLTKDLTTSLVKGLTKHLEKLIPNEVQKVDVQNQVQFPTQMEVGLPKGKDQKVHKRNANPSEYLIVRLTDGKKFLTLDGLGGASVSTSKGGEHLYLREEYTYTTVSGMTVPSRVVKWDDQFKVTLDYTYDGNANPIAMNRSIEPSNGVGI